MASVLCSDPLSLSIATIILLTISSFILYGHLYQTLRLQQREPEPEIDLNFLEPTILAKNLVSALPESVILPYQMRDFKQALNAYWAQQECEVIPACVVRPRSAQELNTAVTILKQEYIEQERTQGTQRETAGGIFAVRGGGHSPIPCAASIKQGAVVDLRLLNGVTPSEDGKSVVVGGGANWMDVSKVLDEKGLAVVGGRNAAVGVGGLTLGGGISFFTPRFGLVCSNVLSYEIVLADGSITTASANTNPDLWRALKGGSNNFGIVSSFTLKSFPCTEIWSGFLYLPAFQTTKVLAAFHDTIDTMHTTDFSFGAGPLLSFSYIPKINLQVIAVNLVSTEVAKNPKKWPVCWKESSFAPLWRYWSTCKVRSLTNATDELNALNPPGRRQTFGTVTIQNEPATIAAAHFAYSDAFASLRRANPKGMVWTIVFQPFLPTWVRKGDGNPLGLHDAKEALVIVSFTVNWDEQGDDELVKRTTRLTLEKIESYATANNTGHKYRYLNYCNEWQKPFQSYGEKNWQFLKNTSKKYDPDGLFQRGCVGGFKLDVDNEA
ncbi:Bifunctional solanapyrone synthase [Lachnellula suecica]|uniref:Bifunctional solanapyrone synthase n=1 Tax=Lachnellula suecica TaxID=602035 RepID=A0A8T9CHK3_9HELO|nr:Bifunctional solanapyrone synthase [Lachnellula suecica]